MSLLCKFSLGLGWSFAHAKAALCSAVAIFQLPLALWLFMSVNVLTPLCRLPLKTLGKSAFLTQILAI